jgi:general secretion pathway protein E
MAQRLVRRLCPDCRRAEPAAPALIERFELERRTADRPIMLSRAVGCPACRQTGYRGRTAIAEFLEMAPEIERLIFARADHATIERAAVAAGMETMFDAGLAAALAGDTTIEELSRSIRADV